MTIALLWGANVAKAQVYQWSWPLSDPLTSQVTDVAFGSNGTVVAIGDFFTTVDFDPGSGTTNLTATANRDAFVMKIDANHDLIWVRQIAGLNVDYLQTVHIDQQDNIYYDGSLTGMADIDPGPATLMLDPQAGDNAYFVKMDPGGLLQWAAVLNCSNNLGTIYDHCLDAQGNVLIFGHFSGTADFDPGAGTFNLSTPTVARESFIWKLNGQGQLLWVKKFDYGFIGGRPAIITDSQNNILISGYFADTVDFDLSANTMQLMAQQGNDAFWAKYDPLGNLQWVKSVGNASNVHPHGMRMGLNDVMFSFLRNNSSPLDIDPGTGVFTINTFHRLALIKLDASGNFVTGLETDWQIPGQSNNFWEVRENQIYVAGNFSTSTDMDPGTGIVQLTPNGVRDGYLVKVGAALDHRWSSQFRSIGQGQVQPSCLAVSPSGTIIMGGQYLQSADLDPSAGLAVYTSNNYDGMLVQMFDSDFVVGESDRGDPKTPLLYPNPNAGRFSLDLGADEVGTVLIYDLQGQLLLQQQVAAHTQMELDFPDGVYLLTIRTETQSHVRRLHIMR